MERVTPLPLYVVTGFLGSGKTSVIRDLLADEDYVDSAVIVNEFGEIGLDHELIESTEEDIVVVRGGCICCTVREDLASTVRRLVEWAHTGRTRPFNRLIIETTGLADPVPILHTVKSDPRIKDAFELAGVVTTVDALVGRSTLEQHVESLRQIIYADRLVITKCDLVSSGAATALEKFVREINPFCSVIYPDLSRARAYRVFEGLIHAPLESLLALPLKRVRGSSAYQHTFSPTTTLDSVDLGHTTKFSTFSWELEDDIQWTGFAIWLTMLLHAHGDKILRVKGIMNVVGAKGPVAIHGVQHIVYPPRHLPPQAKLTRSQLVFVVQDLSPGRVRESFDTFQAFARETGPVGTLFDSEQELGAGGTVGGRPARRPRAAAWIKG